MVGIIKVFLLGWGSILLFWGAALFFCFVGTEVVTKYWKRKLFIGLPFFALFYFLVHAYGVPRYFVYDHVEPLSLNGKMYYPAAKNHPIFQGTSFKTYGVISQDLDDFISGEQYFTDSGVSPLEDYPSVSGIKRWTNELILLAFFLLWWVLLNKVHNASAASALYRDARKENRLGSYLSYINASGPIRFLQPLKRRNASREVRKIRQVYIQYLNTLLLRLAAQTDQPSQKVLQYIGRQLNLSTDTHPSISTKGVINDVTSKEETLAYEQGVTYDRSYFKPSDSELSQALGERVAATLNQFLPEPFLTSNEPSEHAAIDLVCQLNCKVHGKGDMQQGNEQMCIVGIFPDASQVADENRLLLKTGFYTYPPKLRQGKQDTSRSFCANQIAQYITHDTLFSDAQRGKVKEGDDKLVDQKLQQAKSRQSQLFDAIFNECKSAAKDAALAEAVSVAIKNNAPLVDSAMAEIHQLLAENTASYAQFIAQEAIGGLLEGIVDGANE